MYLIRFFEALESCGIKRYTESDFQNPRCINVFNHIAWYSLLNTCSELCELRESKHS